MPQVLEINAIEDLIPFGRDWEELLSQTPGASFFQSLPWLQVYWRHFGAGQKLRALVVQGEDRPAGILPLVVRRENSKVGPLRVLTFPLHAWGSFYGPVGPDPAATLAAGLEHVRRTRRDWDMLELRWQGAVDTDFRQSERAMIAAGFQAYTTVWDRTAVVDLDGTWEAYWSSRKGAWLRRFRHAERRLSGQGKLDYVRYRPAGPPLARAGATGGLSASACLHNGTGRQAARGTRRYRPAGLPDDDGSPRWDLYDACEELARRSWQAAATNGTTLSHPSVRGFLREVHQAAAQAGAVDLNLLYLDGSPLAFVYGYHYRGYVYGMRRGYDPERTPEGAGNVLLAYTLRDSFARRDRLYDMGVGSLESKRYFQTRVIPVLRLSHFPPLAPRTQPLRLARWWQGCRTDFLIRPAQRTD